MGTNQSKEEVILAQAGNSGGTSISTREACGIVVLVIAMLAIVAIGVSWCNKALKRRIRKEIARSMEEV
jgi:hypothetical protein